MKGASAATCLFFYTEYISASGFNYIFSLNQFLDSCVPVVDPIQCGICWSSLIIAERHAVPLLQVLIYWMRLLEVPLVFSRGKKWGQGIYCYICIQCFEPFAGEISTRKCVLLYPWNVFLAIQKWCQVRSPLFMPFSYWLVVSNIFLIVHNNIYIYI